jgi:hypothetical protein
MTEDQDNQIGEQEQEHKPFTDKGLNKALAILFVLGLYFVIFLKILFIN